MEKLLDILMQTVIWVFGLPILLVITQLIVWAAGFDVDFLP